MGRRHHHGPGFAHHHDTTRHYAADHRSRGSRRGSAGLTDPVRSLAGGYVYYAPSTLFAARLCRSTARCSASGRPAAGTTTPTPLSAFGFTRATASRLPAASSGHRQRLLTRTLTTSSSSSRADYLKLFRIALRASRRADRRLPAPGAAGRPTRSAAQNTLGYLDRRNLKRIKDLGGRAKRGLLADRPAGQRQDQRLPLAAGGMPSARAGASDRLAGRLPGTRGDLATRSRL